MARPLARGGYSEAQVAAVIRSATYKFRARFDLCDADGRRLGEPGALDAYILSAVVDWDGDRSIQRSLAITMLPFPDLLGRPLQYTIQVYWAVQMPDDGWAEWPMGLYVFTVPDRTIYDRSAVTEQVDTTDNVETWQVTCPDQTYWLDVAGPHLTPFQVGGGSQVDTGVRQAATRANIVDLSGIIESTETFTSALTFSYQRGPVRTTRKKKKVYNTATKKYVWKWVTEYVPLEDAVNTWRGIIAYFNDELGYNPPWFDLDNNRLTCAPARDLSAAIGYEPLIYEIARDGLIVDDGIGVSPDLSEIANFAIVTAQNPAGYNDIGTADLNTLIPLHPLAQKNMGRYIDASATSSVAGSTATLNARAKTLLYRRIATLASIECTTLANPAHDAWEIVVMRVPGDPELDTPQLCAEYGWAFDLMTARMTHDLRRTYQYAGKP